MLKLCVLTTLVSRNVADKMASNNSFWCSAAYPTTMRQLPGVSCCNPQAPSKLNIRFRLFRPGQPEVDIKWDAAALPAEIGDGRVNFVAHGYFESYQTSTWMPALVKAYNDVQKEQVI